MLKGFAESGSCIARRCTQHGGLFGEEAEQRVETAEMPFAHSSSVEKSVGAAGPGLGWQHSREQIRGEEQRGGKRIVAVLNSFSWQLSSLHNLQAISNELRGSNFVKGWLLIVKAYLGVSAEDQDVGADFDIVTKASYPDADSVYRIHPLDSTQRSWLVFNSYLVVPEYLVEFEYVYGNEAARGYSPWQTETATQDSYYVASRSRFIVGLLSDVESQILQETEIPNVKLRMQHDQSESPISTERRYLCGIPMLKRTPYCNLSKVTYLNLHNSSINVVEPMKGLLNLKVLILSFNNISHIRDEFQAFTLLEVLDLSFNLLKQVDGLGCLKALTTLDMSGNQLSTLNDLQHLLFEVPKVAYLNLRCNPVEELKSYKEIVLKSLSFLKELDCAPVDAATSSFVHGENHGDKTEGQREVNVPGVFCSTALELPSKILQKFVANNQKSTIMKLHSTGIASIIVDCDVEELCLEYQHLKSMLVFGTLSSLRKLFLSGNEFVILEGLDNCTLLEELFLEDNCINQLTSGEAGVLFTHTLEVRARKK
ncbi:hypothetical protein L7F22_002211 [Adiantum nelumboides]|nr:hypothetical protein [Adiantum nelumboides]